MPFGSPAWIREVREGGNKLILTIDMKYAAGDWQEHKDDYVDHMKSIVDEFLSVHACQPKA